MTVLALPALVGCTSDAASKNSPAAGGAGFSGNSGTQGVLAGGATGAGAAGAGPITGAGGVLPGAGGAPPITGTGGMPPGSGGANVGGSSSGTGGMSTMDSGAGASDAGDASAPGTHRPASSLSLPVTKETQNVDPFFNVYRPQDLTATGQQLPVIVWANGGCVRYDDEWATLFNRWAAGGFVVLTLATSPNGEKPLFDTTDNTVKDQGALIDWALQKADFAGKLDTKKIIAAGNSCGGVTALTLASKDPRVTAVFVLSGSSALGATERLDGLRRHERRAPGDAGEPRER